MDSPHQIGLAGTQLAWLKDRIFISSGPGGQRRGLRDLMARVGHDSERTVMIYQDEARGADQAITSAID